MIRTFVGGLVVAVVVALAGRAEAQVVIQGQAQAGGVYGQGTVYVQPAQQPQPVVAQPSPYVTPGQPMQPMQPQPVRTIVHTAPTTALLIPGVIALAGGWLISGLGSLAILEQCSGSCPYPDGDWAGYGWIPVVGPWLALGMTYPYDYEAFNVIMGIAQGAGLILTVLGLVIQHEWEEAIYVDLGEGRQLAFDVGGRSAGAQLEATLTF